MDVIVIAGGIPDPKDPLYFYTQGKPKAMLPVDGKPMVQCVLDCLAASKKIDQVLLVGLDESYQVSYPRRLTRLPNQGGMVANITIAAKHLLESGSTHDPQVLVMASDVPAVRPEMIDWLAGQVEGSDSDITYTVVTQESMESRFPESHRSYIKLKDVVVCGGDVNAINIKTVNYDNPLWTSLVNQRKNVLKQAAIIGFDTLFLVATKKLTLAQVEERVCKRLKIKGRLIVSPFPETAMDVDKPEQLQMLESEFRLSNLMRT